MKDLAPEFEEIMELVRGKVSPNKAAAISGILYAEELRYSPERSILKLGDAQSFLEAERRQVAQDNSLQLQPHVQHTVIQ